MLKKSLTIFCLCFFFSCFIACNEEKTNTVSPNTQNKINTTDNDVSFKIDSLDESVQHPIQNDIINTRLPQINEIDNSDENNQNYPDTEISPIKIDTDRVPLSQSGIINCNDGSEIPYTILSEGIVTLHDNPLDNKKKGVIELSKDDAELARLKDIDFDNNSVWYIFYDVKPNLGYTFYVKQACDGQHLKVTLRKCDGPAGELEYAPTLILQTPKRSVEFILDEDEGECVQP